MSQTLSFRARRLRARNYFYELLVTPEIDAAFERTVKVTLEVLIALSVLIAILQTEESIDRVMHQEFHIFEITAVAIFALEYCLRIWCCVEDERYRDGFRGRLRFARTPLAIVDLAAVLPFFLPMLITTNLVPLRALRLIRLVRVLKMGHYTRSLNLILHVIKKKRHEIMMTFLMVLILLLVSSTLVYYLEHDAQPQAFSSIPKALWWGVATLTTIGYGDVYPVTILGKFCVGFIAILGIGVFALPSGILVSGFLDEIKNDVHLCDNCNKPIVRNL